MFTQTSLSQERITQESLAINRLAQEISTVVVGNQEVIQTMLMALLCKGHVLIEGVPGVAKTTLVKAITQTLGLTFKRIQFTPDLLPADLIGTLIFNQKTVEFETKKGPIFAHLVLADEINRAPAKVQSALLEAMQERQVTIGNSTYQLEEPFFVFATQNPIEQEGTYRLPEAQVDRFMFKVLMGYPTMLGEKQMLHASRAHTQLPTIFAREELIRIQQLVEMIYVDEKIIDYIIAIIFATREPSPFIQCGASPRATLAMLAAARASAFLQQRSFVIPDDVKRVAYPVLRHRITLSYEAESAQMTPDKMITTILSSLKVP